MCLLLLSYLFIVQYLTLTLTLKIVYLDTTDILHLNYYVQHIGNKKKYYIGCAKCNLSTRTGNY